MYPNTRIGKCLPVTEDSRAGNSRLKGKEHKKEARLSAWFKEL